MEMNDLLDQVADRLVEIELNRHAPAISVRLEPPSLMTASCGCGWNWEGGWVPRTGENLDAVETAIRAHLDDVATGPRGAKR